MLPLITLGLIAFLPLIFAVIFRIKPLYLFVSIVTGYFWAQFLGESAELALSSLIRSGDSQTIVNIALFMIPVVLTFILMRHTLSAAALPFQFILLVADSLLLAILLIPLLSSGTQASLYQTNAGNVMRQSHDVAIAGIAGLHMLVMFLMRPKPHSKHGKHHK